MTTATVPATCVCGHPESQHSTYPTADGGTARRCDGYHLSGGWPLGTMQRCGCHRGEPAGAR